MKRFASQLTLVTLLLLAAAGMAMQAGSVPHVHVGNHPGLYNEEHDLTLLAGLAGHGIPVETTPALALAAASDSLLPFVPEHPVLHLGRSGDSRAPPLR